MASRKAGISEVPALVATLDRDAAVIVLVDSNLHREHILPSEKAFAYKMKLEAMKHQGWRSDLTSPQIVAKSRTTEMVGAESGDSHEQVRRYIRLTNLIPEILQYMCKKARKKKCDKKIIGKDYIEDRVVSECLKMLTDEKIRYIAKKVAEECNKSPDNISVREIKKAIKEVDTAIENLWKGIEQGQAVDMLTERLHQRQAEKAELETQLAIENNKKICLSEAQILAFLDYVCEMPLDDFNKRRAIINIFVHSIYLYDDHFTLIVNASKKPLSIENIPLDDIEEAFEGENSDMEGCSSLMTPAPPKQKRRACGVFAYFPRISGILGFQCIIRV